MKVSQMLQHRSIKFHKWWKDSLKRGWCHRLTSKRLCLSDSTRTYMTTKNKKIKSMPNSRSNTEAQGSSLPIKIQTQRKPKREIMPRNSSRNKLRTSWSTTQCQKELSTIRNKVSWKAWLQWEPSSRINYYPSAVKMAKDRVKSRSCLLFLASPITRILFSLRSETLSPTIW